MIFQNAHIFNGKRFVHGDFAVFRKRFISVGNAPEDDTCIDLHNRYVIPGLIDIHTHGNSGADFSDGDYNGLVRMGHFYASHGITSFCPTSMTISGDDISTAFLSAARLAENKTYAGSRMAGIHMEGPYFSEAKKGAQNPEFLQLPDKEKFRILYNNCNGLVRIVDVAPELPGAVGFASAVSSYCTVSAAHTAASYEETKAFYAAGASHLTHLYNAMPGIHHRSPGVIGAAAENPEVTAELISDGLHVHESAVRMAFKLFPGRICLISDSLRCAGMPDGEYMLGGQKVYLADNIAKLADGTIAGSSADLYQCMLNAIRFGVDKATAINAATINPAKVIKADGLIGSIEPGKFADFVICDKELNLQSVYIGGKLYK